MHLIFLGTAIGVKEDTHVKISFIFEKTKGKVRVVLQILNYIIMIVVFLLFLINGMKQTIIEWPHTGPILSYISMGIVYFAIPLCGFLSICFMVANIIKAMIKTKKDQEK